VSTAVAEHRSNPAADLKNQLDRQQDSFNAALPKHIPVERFMRVVMTATQQNPALLRAERKSLFMSSLKAAQDGLLPDGREAALVIYRDKSRGEIVQYMPMIAGLRKKVRNSGEIATWDAQVVYENDQFEYELGDEPFIKHKPAMGDRGNVIGAYSVAVLKSGEKSREVMSISEIESIRKRSRASGNGPWVTDYAEMCRKTVARRHSKVLPMSTDLDDLIRRDDDLYDMKGASDAIVADRPKSLSARMDALAAPAAPADAAPDINGEPEGPDSDDGQDGALPAPPRAWGSEESIAAAYSEGVTARANGVSIRKLPDEYREEEARAEADAWENGHAEGARP
jgi:recombination protein RecT